MTEITFAAIEKNIIASRGLDEANLRKQLAYLYRIFDYYNWCDLIVTHLSVRIPGEDALLILPFGLSFDEITPNNLVKVGFDGRVLHSSGGFNINKNGTTVHCAIYSQKPEINCILHTHSTYGVAVSNQDNQLMLLDQIAMMFHNKVGYHNFETLFINDNKQEQLIKDMAGHQSLILKNHGLITVAKTLTEAFWFHYYLETSCKVHVLSQSGGAKIHYPHPEVVKATADKYEIWREKNDHISVSDSELLFDAAKRKVAYIFG